MMMRQVALVRDSEHGFYEDIYWIDAELAKKGNRVIDESGRVWRVAEIYGLSEHDELDGRRRVWKQFVDVLDGH